MGEGLGQEGRRARGHTGGSNTYILTLTLRRVHSRWGLNSRLVSYAPCEPSEYSAVSFDCCALGSSYTRPWRDTPRFGAGNYTDTVDSIEDGMVGGASRVHW